MKTRFCLTLIILLLGFGHSLHAQSPPSRPAAGPLRIHPANPRYFTDSSGKVVYLTGSHNWDTFQRWFEGEVQAQLKAGRPGRFADYLDVLQSYHHNFIRLWVADTAWSPITRSAIEPQPYVRIGPGKAADGGLKFDLNQLNQAYFDELRKRVIAARDRGMYVAVMLFDSWGISKYQAAPHDVTWDYHPFNKANNINGIDGDPNGDGRGLEYHTLRIAAITRLQEAYVRKEVDTVNDLDNVLYEISNESEADSKDWQYHMIKFIKKYEATRPKQHPILMSGSGVSNADLFASPADAVAPAGIGDNPPAATGAKVVIVDSDHNGSTRRDPEFAWKTFLRGNQPIVMDWWSGSEWDPIRRALGQTRAYADKMNLASMTPHDDFASTKYCLADPGTEYLVYLPSGGTVTVDLTAAAGELKSEWLHPVNGTLTSGGTIEGGAKRTFKAPFNGGAVLRLWKK
jgi:hypothetical protein